MTLDEKIDQMHGIRESLKYRMIPALPRLGIPEFHVTNGPAGVSHGWGGRQKPPTALPSPTALAASWDVELAHLYGEIAGTETLALGSQLLEGPDINIIRVPQNGRAFENYSEDPYLTSRMAVANIQGIQSAGALANVKHFLANNQETGRTTINEIIPERTLREIYLPGFEASVKEGHVASVMCAYPRINGAFACENKAYLHDILKQDCAHLMGVQDGRSGVFRVRAVPAIRYRTMPPKVPIAVWPCWASASSLAPTMLALFV